MKTFFFSLITVLLIMAGCQAYGSTMHPEPTIQHSERIARSLRHCMVAPSHCPFTLAGHF